MDAESKKVFGNQMFLSIGKWYMNSYIKTQHMQ
jgi:hypothetical protein